MKTKKALFTLATVAMSAVSAFSFAACGNDSDENEKEKPHTHSYEWTGEYDPAPTCTEPGIEIGVCPDDGAKTTRSVDALGHRYGNWKIDPAPTQDVEGKAEQVCANDNTHKNEVVLPALSNEDAYTIVENATDGTTTYTLKTNKDISFSVKGNGEIIPPVDPDNPTPPDEPVTVDTVADAVKASTTAQQTALVRKGEGVMGTVFTGNNNGRDYAVRYEFGDNFCYTYDEGDRTEYYYSMDGDNLFGIKVYNNTPEYYTGGRLENMNGVEFYLTYTTQSRRFYGVEGLLSSMYEWAKTSDMYSFWEKAEPVDGEEGVYNYSFGCGYHNTSYDNMFAVFEVTFTLFDNHVIKDLEITSSNYLADNYTYDDDEGTYEIKDPDASRYIDHIKITQVLKEEGDEVKENEYSKDKCFVEDITLYTNSAKTSAIEGDVLNLSVDGIVHYYLDVKLDVYELWYQTADGEWEKASFWDTDVISNYSVSAGTGDLSVRPMIKGEIKIQIRSQVATKEFTINAKAKSPNNFSASVYGYIEVSDSYTKYERNNSAEVYVGKPLYFTNYTQDPSKEETEYNAVINTDKVAKFEKTTLNGEEVYVFIATEAGEYTITLNSLPSGKQATLTVTVKDVPDMSEILTGKYKAAEGYEIEFAPSEDNALTGTVTITSEDGTDTLSYVFDNGDITTTHVSGAELNCTLSFNDLYHLVLVFNDGFEDNIYLLVEVTEDGGVPLAAQVAGTTWNGKTDLGQELIVIFYEDGTMQVAMMMTKEEGGMCWMIGAVEFGKVQDGNASIKFQQKEAGGMASIVPINADDINEGYLTVEDGEVTGIVIKGVTFYMV